MFYLSFAKRSIKKIGSIKGEAGKSNHQLAGENKDNGLILQRDKGDIFTLWEEVRGYHKSEIQQTA